jgi:hypothetical protein
MIQYFYLLEYFPETIPLADERPNDDENIPECLPLSTESPKKTYFATHALVFALADKYGVDGLKEEVMWHFSEEQDWVDIYDLPDFLKAVKLAYTTTPSDVRELRDAVVKTFRDHRNFLEDSRTMTLLKEVEGLAYDVLMGILGGERI